ncbi:MAG: ankyrin repeat domain-containing protein [Opitutaceae bacterium]|nr:ankyrin repeat domain-containing protein [Opitutaceae bacterium]
MALLCLALLAAPLVTLAELPPAKVELQFLRGDRTLIEALIAEAGGVKTDTAARFLGHAAATGDIALLERLLALGVPPDLVIQKGDGAGQNALMWAAGYGCVPSIELLLRKGAKGNAIGSFHNASGGNSLAALRGAVASGSVESVRCLLEAGADPNVMGGSVMTLADENGESEMLQLLHSHGGRLPVPPATTRTVPPGAGPAAWREVGLAELLPTTDQTAPAPEGNGRCRLAIIADSPNLAAADLLAARLSQSPNIDLVERQELDRILAERKLDRLFATSAENAAHVGTWLQADALVLVRTRQVADHAVIETSFVRVLPGVVLNLAYSAAPLTVPAAWAGIISQQVPSLAAKALSKDAIALAVLECTEWCHSPSIAASNKLSPYYFAHDSAAILVSSCSSVKRWRRWRSRTAKDHASGPLDTSWIRSSMSPSTKVANSSSPCVCSPPAVTSRL